MWKLYICCLVLLVAIGAPGVGFAQNNAKARFQEGIALFQVEKYQEALIAFEDSYRITPKYSVLYNIAMCHQALFHYAESIETFNRLIAEGADQLNRDKLESAKASLKKLLALVGTVELTNAPDGATLAINGKAAGTTPLAHPLYLNPGEYGLTLTKDGYRELSTRITVMAGALIQVQTEMEPSTPADTASPAAPPTNGSANGAQVAEAKQTTPFGDDSLKEKEKTPVLFITSLCLAGLGAGGVGIGGYFTWQYNQHVDDIRALDPSADNYNDQYNQIADEKIPNDKIGMAVGYSVGGALMLTGIVLFIVDRVKGKSERESSVSFAPAHHGVAVRF